MTNVILIIALLLIIGAAVIYIIKAKRRGVKCIGCPAGGTCNGHCNGNFNGQNACDCNTDKKQ